MTLYTSVPPIRIELNGTSRAGNITLADGTVAPVADRRPSSGTGRRLTIDGFDVCGADSTLELIDAQRVG